MRMADALDGIRKWASTVGAGLAIALVIGGLNLHRDVQLTAMRVEAVTVLAQTTETGRRQLDTAVSGINESLEGLRRDVDKVADAVERQAREADKDRALILQELGRLQGATDNAQRRPNQ